VRTDENGQQQVQTREERKNALGKVAWVTDGLCTQPGQPSPDCPTTSYGYDADGNLTRVFDPQGNVTQIHYDARGRKDVSTDPDMGTWTYAYDGFGDLVSQRDAKLVTVTMTYDKLGRLRTRTDSQSGKEADWVYDKVPGGVGKLSAMVSEVDDGLRGVCTAPHGLPSGEKRAVRSLTYTQFGELATEQDCIDGDAFLTTHEYDDAFGRPSVLRYPAAVNGERFAVKYNYTSLGYLYFLTNEADGTLLWEGTARNALGQITDETTGNAVETVSLRNPSTGWLLGSSSTAHADGNTVIQDWTYRFDEVGNLRARERSDGSVGAPFGETFTYDVLNRLKSSRVQRQGYDVTETYDYDAIGNLTHKAGVPYNYGACSAGPHAMCGTGSDTGFQYDPNGNLRNGRERSLNYNSYNKPTHISNTPTVSQGNDTGTADFIYGADGHRVVQEIGSPSGSTARTVYVGLGATGKSIYERTTKGGTIEFAHFIYAGDAHGGSAFALRVVSTGSGALPPAMKYYQFDHLGSVTAISDESGHVVGQDSGGADATSMGYDAWGARRNPDGTAAAPASFKQQVGRREFTGHETIPNVGLVNMNGRVYDPVLARFLSADPNVQFADNAQSYNRYSYVLNNPLKYADPTGFFLNHHFGFWDFATGDFQRERDQVREHPEQLAMTAFAVGACVTGVGCVAAGLMVAAMNASIQVGMGASTEQVMITTGIGIAAGAIGGGVTSSLGGSLAAQLVGGGVSGAISSAIVTGIYGGDLGTNVLQGAFNGIQGAAFSYGVSKLAPVSQASIPEAQGRKSAEQIEISDQFLPDAPEPVAGDVDPAEPIANRQVRRGLLSAYEDSNPGSGTDSSRHEQGGYIIRRHNPLTRFLFGEYYVERLDPGSAARIAFSDPPDGVDVVGSFHTHPNNPSPGDQLGWLHSASKTDWFNFGDGSVPHYIVSGTDVFRLQGGVQTDLGAIDRVLGR
jgi:RHS repeat-associated protein